MRTLGPPEYLVFARELKYIFLCTLTCKQCSTWFNLESKLKSMHFS